jgi:hypothetical protein
MDDAKQKHKEASTKKERKENKPFFTMDHFTTLCGKMPAIYQRALNYGKVPTPLSGEYPRGDDTGQFQARLAHMGGLIKASTEAFYNNNNSSDSRNTDMQAHKAGTDTSRQEQSRDTTNNNRNTRGTKRTTTDATKPSEKSNYVNPGKITNPIIITDKTGQKCGIFPRRMITREKDEWLGVNLPPKSEKKCRAGATYDPVTKIYTRCHMTTHYTDEHSKLFPEQAKAEKLQLEAAGDYQRYHPLANTDDSVSPEEWDRQFPDLPCYSAMVQQFPLATTDDIDIIGRIRRRRSAERQSLTASPAVATTTTTETFGCDYTDAGG